MLVPPIPRKRGGDLLHVHLLELLGKYSDMAVVERRAIRMNNRLTDGNRRDVVKFVTKRLPCTCLKELHRAAREKVAKVGKCKGYFLKERYGNLHAPISSVQFVHRSPSLHQHNHIK